MKTREFNDATDEAISRGGIESLSGPFFSLSSSMAVLLLPLLCIVFFSWTVNDQVGSLVRESTFLLGLNIVGLIAIVSALRDSQAASASGTAGNLPAHTLAIIGCGFKLIAAVLLFSHLLQGVPGHGSDGGSASSSSSAAFSPASMSSASFGTTFAGTLIAYLALLILFVGLKIFVGSGSVLRLHTLGE